MVLRRIRYRVTCRKWKELCELLGKDDAIKVLRVFSSKWAVLLKDLDNFSLPRFLEDDIANKVPSVLGKKDIPRIGLFDTMDVLCNRLHFVSPTFDRISISLVMNAYSRIYADTKHAMKTSKINTSGREEEVKRSAMRIIPKAIDLMPRMNEQDLSLFLNAVTKLEIQHNGIMRQTNELLYNDLRDYYKGTDGNDNLIRNMNPQGIALILNCFSRSDINFDVQVMNYVINQYLPQNHEKFETRHLAIVLHSSLRMNFMFRNVWKVIVATDERLSKQPSDYSIKLLSTLLYTFSKYKYFPSLSLPEILKFLHKNNYTKNTELEISNLYYALGKLNVRDMQLLNKMNENIWRKLDKLTAQAVVNIYNSLSRLDYFKPGDHNYNLRSEHPLHKLLLSTFLGYFDGDVPEIYVQKSVLPRHILNMLFCTMINYILDPNLYNFLLGKLAITRIIGDGSSSLKDMDTNEKDLNTLLVRENIGIRGIYQLYCISHYINLYFTNGLQTLSLDALSIVYDLIDQNTDKLNIKDNLNEGPTHLTINSNDTDEPIVITSKIHFSVYRTLENLISKGYLRSSGAKNANLAKPLLYREYEVTPYVIDIFLHTIMK
ncbi:hypothetical protein BEWA_031800 [Theileria equi strain WA]|uniref:Uncharacterized protein n=1 Tax=Theileria equi strain WA TaxID=1537102 RepID=L0AXN1_THEEQ|nr:hypothetical protein BEWA_031800 [Theileria equi strain WA]AFZ80327.1 hypothetical protein BEWA_031800 [Theileria equi strain WA]|eukprot:XP_004829993.1 hypothetical protein BEWA_031800 [Theileria equi strain WA]